MKYGRKENCLELSETIYERYESINIRRSTFELSLETFNECVFYDSDDNVVAKLTLPIDVYNEQFGLTISYDNTKVFLQRWSTPLRCYSISDGKILWRSKLRRVNQIFAFENFLYCSVYNKGIYIVDAENGDIIERKIKLDDYCSVYRISREVFFLYFDHKMICCNMATQKLWKPPIDLGLNERVKELILRDEIEQDSQEQQRYIIQKIKDLGESISIKFFTTKNDGQNDEYILNILKKDLL